jgi:hypothetical protein
VIVRLAIPNPRCARRAHMLPRPTIEAVHSTLSMPHATSSANVWAPSSVLGECSSLTEQQARHDLLAPLGGHWSARGKRTGAGSAGLAATLVLLAVFEFLIAKLGLEIRKGLPACLLAYRPFSTRAGFVIGLDMAMAKGL